MAIKKQKFIRYKKWKINKINKRKVNNFRFVETKRIDKEAEAEVEVSLEICLLIISKHFVLYAQCKLFYSCNYV